MDNEEGKRKAGPETDAAESPTMEPFYDKSWALIVGIDDYGSRHTKLNNAVNDAEAVAKLLTDFYGFEQVATLFNEQASKRAVLTGLRDNLPQQLGENDRLVLFFAGHGATEKGEIGYLIPQDAEHRYADYIDMDELTKLCRRVAAKHVLIVLDCCFSGIAALKFRATPPPSPPGVATDAYLRSITEREAYQILTAGASDELAADSSVLPGHSAFTAALLDGLKGQAAKNTPGLITATDLSAYVSPRVTAETRSRGGEGQTPFSTYLPGSREGNFVFNLPIAALTGISAEKHYQLARHLYRLGMEIDDRQFIASACRELQEALRLPRPDNSPFLDAQVQLGRALIALGQYRDSVSTLSKFSKQNSKNAEVFFYLGVADAHRGNYSTATRNWKNFLDLQENDDNAEWVADYMAILNQPRSKYALLVGIDHYQSPDIPQLGGSVSDVDLVRTILLANGFADANMDILTNSGATYRNVSAAFDKLATRVKPGDTVVIYFTGHSDPRSDDAYLIFHDSYRTENRFQAVLSSAKLHSLLKDIPARFKTAILDTHPNPIFVDLAKKDADYALLLSASIGQMAYELPLDGIRAGLFSYCFAKQLRTASAKTITYGRVMDKIVEEMDNLGRTHQVPAQTPLFVGNRDRNLFTGIDSYLTDWAFGERRNYKALGRETVERNYMRLRRTRVKFPKAYYSFGRALLEKGNLPSAIQALQTAISQRDEVYPEALLALARAEILIDIDGAIESTQNFLDSVRGQSIEPKIQQALVYLREVLKPERFALLVGVDEYRNGEAQDVDSVDARKDVLSLKQVLVEKCGFQEKNITMLINRAATPEAILDASAQLFSLARDHPALFYFAGDAVRDVLHDEDRLAIFDKNGETYYIDPRRFAGEGMTDATNLTTILDIGRYGPKPSLGTRDLGVMRSSPLELTGSFVLAEVEERGLLTSALLKALWNSEPGQLTKRDLRYRIEKYLQALRSRDLNPRLSSYWRGSEFDKVFGNNSAVHHAIELLIQAELVPLRSAVDALRRNVQQEHAGSPEAHYNLGVAYAAIKEYEDAIEPLEEAITQKRYYPEAHYYLGRMIYETNGDLNRAISELRLGTESEANSQKACAWYYLGQSLQRLANQEIKEDVKTALQEYLDRGAPLGMENEVKQQLASIGGQNGDGDR